jgi:hypothetical protein
MIETSQKVHFVWKLQGRNGESRAGCCHTHLWDVTRIGYPYWETIFEWRPIGPSSKTTAGAPDTLGVSATDGIFVQDEWWALVFVTDLSVSEWSDGTCVDRWKRLFVESSQDLSAECPWTKRLLPD